jgi:cytidylate kinase
LAGKGHEVELSNVLEDQRRRDKDDTERAIAPLKPAPDAIVVDTTGLDLDQVVDRCFRAVRERVAA